MSNEILGKGEDFGLDEAIKAAQEGELRLLCELEEVNNGGVESLEEEKQRIISSIDKSRLVSKLLINIQKNLFAFQETKSFKVRVNQLLAVQDLIKFLKENTEEDLKGYFVQPTGAGKTILMGILIRLLDVPTLVLVPNKNLLYQSKNEFLSIPGISESDIGLVGDYVFDTSKKITICTYQSLKKLRSVASSDYGFIICDEAHRALGEKTQEHLNSLGENEQNEDLEIDFADIENYIPRSGLQLGFTATPDLKDKRVLDHFKTLVSRVSYKSLVDSGVLVKFCILNTEGKIFSEDVEGGGITEEKECQILEREQSYQKLLDKFMELRAKVGGHVKTAAYCVNFEECKKFQVLADVLKLKTVIITHHENGDGDLLKRSEAAMMRKELDIIITIKKLGEGWNFPPLETVILARATMSPVMVLQPAGRSCRAYNGKEKSFVLETDWRRVRSKSLDNGIGIDNVPDDYTENEAVNSSEGQDNNTLVKNNIGKVPYSLVKALWENGETDLEGICEGENGEMIDYVAVEKAPEGWFNNKGLAMVLKVNPQTVNRVATKYRNSNPKWFKLHLDKMGHSVEYYAPELVEIIKSELSQREKASEKAPEGWFSNNGLAMVLKVAPQTVNRVATTYRNSNPEWFKLYLDKMGHSVEYYAPELVEIIKSELSQREKALEKAPEGWFSNNGLAMVLKVSNMTVNRVATKYRKSNPEWFKLYLDKMGHSIEHYAPELVENVKNELSQKEKAPEGWFSNSGLAMVLKVDPQTVNRVATTYRNSNPEWFKLYLDKMGHSIEHYAPELVENVKNELSQREKAPEGWFSNRGLAMVLKVDPQTVNRVATKYRKSNPEWFKLYLDKTGRSIEHYAPELVEIIRK